MKLNAILFTSLWASGFSRVVVRQDATSTSALPAPSETIVTRYIVEVQDPSTVDAVEQAVTQADPSLVIVRKWTDKLLPGLCIDSALSLTSVSRIDGVQNVWKSQIIERPAPPGPLDNNDSTAPGLKVRRAKSPYSAVSAIMRRQGGNGTVYQADNYSEALHRMTGVAQLHQEGILGAGVKVAVVDDGVYYNHELLGGGFGPGFKVIGGWDFSSPNNPGEGDSDPAPDINPFGLMGHGTHVAGILAGKNEWFTGVAPNASILAYKMFGGTTSETATYIDAWKRAFDDGADIITMSIGSPGPWIDNPLGVLAARLVENGVVVVVSMGNDGDQGPFYGNEMASGLSELAVASVEADVKAGDPITFTFTLDGQSSTADVGHVAPGRYSVRYRPAPTENGNWDFLANSMEPYAAIWGEAVTVISAGDACSSVSPIANPDQTVVLVAQSGCPIDQKAANLAAVNARYVLFRGDGIQGLWIPDTLFSGAEPAVGYGIIEKEAGDAIISVLSAGGQVTATFNNNVDGFVVPAKHPRGRLANFFSSWGGTYELYLKPDIGAPGGEIYSALVTTDPNPPFAISPTGWQVFNGTSMAAPYIAGVAALYISKHGGRSVHGPGVAKLVMDRIRSSGDHVAWGLEPWQDDPANPNPVPEGTVAPVMHVGTGLVNAVKAVNYQTRLTFDNIALNDTANFRATHNIVITNTGSQPLTYTFSHDIQRGIEARSENRELVAPYTELKTIELTPGVTFPSGQFAVGAGQSRTATITFTPPSYPDPSKWPIYNGRIIITSSNGEELAVPYMGAAFDLKQEVGSVFAGNITSSGGPVLGEGFVMRWPGVTGDDAVSSVSISFELKWGTKFLRMDIFQEGWQESDWTWPPENSPGYAATAAVTTSNLPPGTINVRRSPSWNASSLLGINWSGAVEAGSIQPGQTYHVRFAALRPFGDPAVASDWSFWQTPPMTVLNV
ncbi:hypothetical protein MFIFM68171_08854 [Madurella fahalii]|uniref:Minor extracellular protease vpr n=1 Tax=Madurella fahalii TaxID=1157608 RepID=A0ABQ0GLR3_9PEZI